MKIKISGLIFLLSVAYAYGQELSYETTIQKADHAGYYKVQLSAELLGKLNTLRSDLRVYDSEGREQPYFLHSKKAMSTTSLFKTYDIIEKSYAYDTISYLIFENSNKHTIDNISIIVKNTDVKKRARLSGSNDRKDWYIIKDNYLLHSMHNTEATSELKILNFPPNDYTFFKLEINDNWKLPINIIKVGYYDTYFTKGISTAFQYPIVYQKDSLKKSYVKLELPESKYFEKLQLDITGAEYYSRHATLKVEKGRVNKKGEKEIHYEPISTTLLSSDRQNIFDLNGQSSKTIYLEIDNKDNSPLTIRSATASYLNQYLVTKLNTTDTYTIRFGNKTFNAPNYDIEAFAADILPEASKIAHDTSISLRSVDQQEDTNTLYTEDPYIIWSVIVIVGLLLGLSSFKMIKDMSK